MKNKHLIIYALLIAFWATGEVKCAIKMFKCNWNPVGKAEIIYTVSTFTGFGFITGWINIEDK